MNMKYGQRVTQKDLALRAGVSTSTVSLALRNDRRLPGKTIERIQQIAEEMGYTPDPWLASLSSYRKSDQSKDLNTTIAVLTNWETKNGWRESGVNAQYFEGARRMANQLGYKIEEFWIPEHGGANRTASILYNRGIKGILVMPMPPEVYTLDFDFSNFSVVQVGRTLHWPIVNTVAHDHYSAMNHGVFILREKGYNRIGLAIPEDENKQYACTWLASFLAKQYDFTPEMAKIPIYRPRQLEREPFLKWYRKHRCDVIISNDPILYHYLVDDGIRVPDQVGFSCLCLEEAGEVAGVHMKSDIAGEQAVSLLHMIIMNGQTGCPDNPLRQLIKGSWNDGKTVLDKSRIACAVS